MEGQLAQRLRGAVLFAAAATAWVRGAAADEAEPIRIEYVARPSCPGKEVFLAEVAGRTSRWREESGASSGRRFLIEAGPRADGAHGRVTLNDGGAPPSVREVDGETCAEVVDALALMTALAIDPNASLRPKPSIPAPTPAPEPLHAAPPATPPPPAPPPPPPPVEPSPSRARWVTAIGVPAILATGLAPTPSPGFAPFVEVARLAASVWSPSARLAVRYNESLAIVVPAGTAHVWRALAGTELCPMRVPLPETAALTPCAVFDAGALSGSGTDIPRGRTETRAWVDIGGSARLEWAIRRRVGVELEAAVTVPFFRYALAFPTNPVVTLETVPQVVGFVGAGTSVHFW